MPTSIEGALREAGFSNTEILIIRRLIEDRTCTLRQLAGKTGKSTGVLDQAMKKLIKRNIAERTMVNGNPSFSLKSMDVISRIIEDDVEHKREALQRRHKNFEAFISSITLDKRHPEMEMFSEAEGIKRAYCKLLEHGTELLAYQTSYEGGSDPHWPDFLAQLCRERRRRKIHARVIAHDTLAGRKLQSRDHLELRKTVLVPFDDCPFTFDKFIIGDHIACINHTERRACIIRYPEMAQTERGVFESVWRERAAPRAGNDAAIAAPAPVVPWKVRTIAQLKQFFLAPRSLAVFAGLALVAGGITYALYRQNVYLNTQRVREQVKAIAATAALQFDWKDLEELRTIEDIQKPEYSKVIEQLNEVRRMNPAIKYAYLLRTTNDPSVFTFVADADSLDPFLHFDSDGDGDIDEADENVPPGHFYDVRNVSILRDGLFTVPNASFTPYIDQWGNWITGYSPIKNENGEIIAILSFDISAQEILNLSTGSLRIFGSFFGIFIVFVLIRLAAFHKTLFTDLLEMFRKKKTVYSFVACFVLALIATGVLGLRNAAVNKQRLQDKVESIARTGALQFSADDLAQLQVQDDWTKPEWAKVVGQLKDIREKNAGVFFAYIFRRSATDSSALAFIADSHSLYPFANMDGDATNDVDVDGNGVIDEVDVLQWPGQPYPVPHEEVWKAFGQPMATKDFYEDAWGRYISGYAPITDRTGTTIGVLAVDVAPEEFARLNAQTFFPLGVFFVFFSIFVALRSNLPSSTYRLICSVLPTLKRSCLK